MKLRTFALALALLIPAGNLPLLSEAGQAAAGDSSADRYEWRQWGGPSRDFALQAPALRPDWNGDQQPTELFRRTLLGGHSAIGVADDRIFVIDGRNKRERVLALTLTGKKIWEQAYRVDYSSSNDSFDGPHSAPLIVDDRVVTVAIDATVRAWNVENGELLWLRDLRRDHGVTLPQAGYAASPLLIDGSILLPGLGGDGPGLRRTEAPGLGILSLDVVTGKTRWRKESFPSSHASPVLVQVGDSELAVFHGMENLVAIRPQTGERVWSFELRNGAADNVSFTPLWNAAQRTLLLSHAYDSQGAQAIGLDELGRQPNRIWSNSRLKVEHGNGVLWQGMLLASDGSEPGFLVALDARSGELLWKERLPKATLLVVENQRVLILDADGTLHLANPTRTGSGIVSRLDVLSELSWTAPTLVGRLLLLRGPGELVGLRLP